MATGTVKNEIFPYVLRLEYDKFEQRVFLQHGNGTQTSYSYVPTTRRLSNLQSLTGPVTFQNLNYSYDAVGNVTTFANAIAPMPGHLLGGGVTQTFGYDDLYRLTNATGTIHSIFDPSCGSTYDSTYNLAMTYDNINNIQEKNQAATFTQVNEPTGLTTIGPDTRLTYDWKYSYNSTHPHAPTQIGLRDFFYDSNGNQLGFDVLPGDCDYSTNRNMVWDEENRLVAVGDGDPGVQATNTSDVHFVYDDKGSRVYKLQGGNINAYINQFYTLEKPQSCNGFVASKHIFIGSNRIASQIVNAKDDQTLAIDQATFPCPNCTPCPSCGNSSGYTLVSSANMSWGRNANWSQYSQQVDSQGNNNGSSQQIQYVTVLSDGTPLYASDSVEGTVLGTINSCQTLTLQTLNQYTGFYEVYYNGQTAYVQSAAATVGTPSSCQGVWPSSSVIPQNYFVFFYHPDHLGSTGYMSDGSGVLSEHIEYIPFGEFWIDQEASLQLFPNYSFTDKEWDSETGLYYFGVRYYDPRTSVWQSPDPILDTYLNGKPHNGIYNPGNLGLYSYAQNNPVKLRDTDGRWAGWDDVAAISAGVVGGIVTEAIAQKISGKTDGFGYFQAAIAGGVGGEATLYGSPAAGAVASATTSNLLGQIHDVIEGKSSKFNAASYVTEIGTSLVTSKLFDKVAKTLKLNDITGKGSITALEKQIKTKFGEGVENALNGAKKEISDISVKTGVKLFGARTLSSVASNEEESIYKGTGAEDKVNKTVENGINHITGGDNQKEDAKTKPAE